MSRYTTEKSGQAEFRDRIWNIPTYPRESPSLHVLRRWQMGQYGRLLATKERIGHERASMVVPNPSDKLLVDPCRLVTWLTGGALHGGSCRGK